MLRHRGLQVVLDTVQAAEFDISLFGLSDAQVDRIARSLSANPNLTTDRSFGGFMIREIDGFDVVYLVGRENRQLVVTIGRIRPVTPAKPIEEFLQNLNLVAIFRGATGL